ncbi:MAG TPA: HYR domain-containing protein, partial [Nitrososphaeraceae archaeon]|nr:HYR domain-containing protein [Nitrososphaeraceae archaeon]
SGSIIIILIIIPLIVLLLSNNNIIIPTAIAVGNEKTDDLVLASGNNRFYAGGSTTVNYWIKKIGKDCDLQREIPVKVTINTTPSGVTASPKSLLFRECDKPQPVTFRSSAPNTYSANIVSIPSNYKTNQAAFLLYVLRQGKTKPPNLYIPEDKYAQATSIAGAIVGYSATASNLNGNFVAPVCSPPSGSLFPLGTTTVTCTATDGSGNTATKTFRVTVKDTTPPNITSLINITKEATGPSGSQVTYSVTSSDLVYGTVAPVCSPPSGSLFPLGTTTVTCTATDGSGNTATKTFRVTVRYPVFGGFATPINQDGSSIFKLGNTIPIKFQLKWLNGKFVSDALVQVYVAKISNTITGTEMQAISNNVTASQGNRFKYDYLNNQYIFGLQTKGFSAGTWQIKILLDDGSSPTVNISLKN